MRRLVTVLRDPVAWILVIAGVVEIISGGTAARGSILFAGAGLILADRMRTWRRRPASAEISARPLQAAAASPRWIAVGLAACLGVAVFSAQTLPLTAIVGLIGILGVGWAWLTWEPGAAGAAPPIRGMAVWGIWLLALGIWELIALLGQPTLAEMSYDSPTISYLVDPVIATYWGRVLALGLWAAAGRALLRRA